MQLLPTVLQGGADELTLRETWGEEGQWGEDFPSIVRGTAQWKWNAIRKEFGKRRAEVSS